MRHFIQFFSVSATSLLVFIDGEIWREALRHADISLEKAAQWMDLDPRQLDRQLKGEEGNVLKYNGRHGTNHLPYVAHAWYAVLKFARLRAPRELRRLFILEFLAMSQRRQVRMTRTNERKSA